MAIEFKKCIVLDLDNTLWGGVVGEEGAQGIALSLSGPGAAYVAFQRALLDLKERGVVLAINSRNNPADVLPVIRTHPNMVLREPDFAALRINWQDKVQNMQELSEELRLSLDAMVFLDDDPINRAAMRQALPQVEVPELPHEPAQYTKFLLSLPYFSVSATTDEDKMRGNFYVTERLRREEEKTYSSREEFLKILGIELRVYRNDPSALARLSQMTEKTNQFNIRKQPLSEDELATRMQDPQMLVFHASVTDRFGEAGIVALAIVRKEEKVWHIETYLLSCRVIGRGVEEAFLAHIAQAAAVEGVRELTIDFVPNEKNAPAAEFVKKLFNAQHVTDPATIEAPPWVTVLSR